MSNNTLTTTSFLFGDRHVPPAALCQQAALLEQSGVVDHIGISAQMGNFVPPQLWNTANTPMAAVMQDGNAKYLPVSGICVT